MCGLLLQPMTVAKQRTNFSSMSGLLPMWPAMYLGLYDEGQQVGVVVGVHDGVKAALQDVHGRTHAVLHTPCRHHSHKRLSPLTAKARTPSEFWHLLEHELQACCYSSCYSKSRPCQNVLLLVCTWSRPAACRLLTCAVLETAQHMPAVSSCGTQRHLCRAHLRAHAHIMG